MSDDAASPDGGGVSDGLSLLRRALTALENFDRFRLMMQDGPDASDKMLAQDYAEMGFAQGAQLIPLLRLQTKAELGARLYSEAELNAAVAAERERMRATIADDAYAATFGSLGQYRSALLRAFRA